ncbi:GDSL-type esterase/lipase family protein [Streptomyces sp. NPDC048659]|uniref:GDSL-type esterase/lipase family protein n=1 Tax=Streptomyces sp. NPDC048659 TaxID=3155489 RepID=UPI00342D72FC
MTDGTPVAEFRYLYTYLPPSTGATGMNWELPLGIVTSFRAGRVDVVGTSVQGERRPALVVTDEGDRIAYASVHAISGGGSNSPALVEAIGSSVHAGIGADWHWVILGDFNRAPGVLQQDLAAAQIPGNVIRSGNPTHRDGGELDYIVTDLHGTTWAANTEGLQGSDHTPVRFAPIQAGGLIPEYTYRFPWAGQLRAGTVLSAENPSAMDFEPWGQRFSQVWTPTNFASFSQMGAVYSRLVNRESGECLTAERPNPSLMTRPCTGLDARQMWRFDYQDRLTNANDVSVGMNGAYVGAVEGADRGVAIDREMVDLRYWGHAGFPDPTAGDLVLRDNSTGLIVADEELTPDVEEVARPSDSANISARARWHVTPSNRPGYVQLVNRETGECLRGMESYNSSTYPCMNDTDQYWEYVEGHVSNTRRGHLGRFPDTKPRDLVTRFGVPTTFTLELVNSVPPPSWIPQVSRLAVMPLGDSITLGVGSSTRTGYRPELSRQLSSEVQQVEFVGSQRDADGTHHEGHSGWRIDQLQANIETWLAEAKPNLITLHIGTNDMNRDYQVATAPQRLGALIDQIHAASPDTVVLVASLVPATDPTVQRRVDTYNKAIPGIVADRVQRGYRIAQVSMDGVSTADLNDNLHPNNRGYTKMAAAFHSGIANVGGKGWVKPTVEVKPAPPMQGRTAGDYKVDIDGDGHADYLVVDDNGAVRAYVNTTGADGKVNWLDKGYIASGSSQWTGAQVRFADVGGDARADYIVLSPNGAVRAFINNGGNGNGGWQDIGVIATGSTNWTDKQIRFADIGGDARADYIVLSPNGAARAYVNTTGADGKVKWSDKGFIAAGSASWTDEQIRFADVGGDARADYIVLSPNGAARTYVNNGGDGNGGWQSVGFIASGSDNWLASQVRFADVGGDARADYLVLSDTGALTAYYAVTAADGSVGYKNQGVIATGTGAPGSRVRI